MAMNGDYGTESTGTNREQLETVLQFQAQWGVDDRCVEFLGNLQPEVVATVMADFTHTPEQTNVSAR